MKMKKLEWVDQEEKRKFADSESWGISTTIDLHNCNPALIRDKDYISKFVVELCDFIKVKRFGEPQIVHFGKDPKVSGYSMTQLIETSLVSAHFVEKTNNVYIDIFSCKFYPPYAAACFCESFFRAKDGRCRSEFRK